MKKSLALAIIPVFVLLLIAAVQIYLAKNSYLTPWKGGGFGMFSTNDGNMFRSARVFVSAPNRSEELLLKGDLADLASRVQMFPGDFMLKKLAIEILEDQKKRNLPVDVVEIDVWRVDFDKGTLFPRASIMRRFSYSGEAK
jgi:hypothetical protein